jgi:hypothetical protein
VVDRGPRATEANLRLGDLETAEQALARLEGEAGHVNRIWALAAAARYRGLMASERQFEPHFERALALHDQSPTPFERARTELCFGERLRQAGERRRAREQLEAAAALFLSPKTIEFHLGDIYRKLGIRSRTQLASEMLGPAARAPAVSGAQRRG